MRKQLIEKLKRLGPRYDISYVGVFGSYARGEEDEKSDLDLLVKFPPKTTLIDVVMIERELSKNLKVKVDLQTRDSISPYIVDNVLKDLKVIYEK
jgi:predicted nucleotidyltransferase